MVQSYITSLQSNWKSGLTVALVSIPLSISLAIASGVTPMQGIITGIWAGLIASLFADSNFNIIGPTGALSGLIASYAFTHGAQSVSGLAVMVGVFVLISYALYLERFLIFIPSSVIHGFTLGVACIIGLKQIGFVTDSVSSVFIFAIFLSALFSMRIITYVPGAIILSPIGIILGYAASTQLIPLHIETLGSTFGNINAVLWLSPEFILTKATITTALVIAFVAIVETLLSAKIADGMTKTKHNSRKEIWGLGLANIGSGLMGGIPATAALARTALNIKTGARSRMSATCSSILMAVLAVIIFSWFSYIPMAVIAAILVHVAVNMVEREHFDRLWIYDRTNFFVALVVAAITVYEDPIIGILVGTVMSLLFFMHTLSHGHYRIIPAEYKGSLAPDVLIYSIKGNLIYINSLAHVARFETDFQKYETVVLTLRGVYFIDLDGVDALDEIVGIIQSRGQKVLIADINPAIEAFLKKTSHVLKSLEKKGYIFHTIPDAVHSLKA